MKSNVLFVATLAAIGVLASTAVAAQSGDAGVAGNRTPHAHGERADGKGPRGAGGHRGLGFDGIAGLDADNDGRISRAEVEQAQQRLAEARADRGERRGQRNARRERPQSTEGTVPAPGPRGFGGALLENFDAIDANSDGYIVRAELQAWQEQRRSERQAQAGQRFAERFAEADSNGDGRLTQAEVAEKWPRIAERFNWFDTNGDGYLSIEELRPPARSR